MALKDVENRLERLFNRTLSRPGKTGLQPIDIATQVLREIDLTRQVSPQGLLSANHVSIWIGADDARRFEGYQKVLVTELEESVRQHALAEGYSFIGPVAVSFYLDDDIRAGHLSVVTEFAGGVSDPRIILSDGRSFALGDRALIVGRSPDVDIVLNDNNISRKHCEFWRTSEGVAVRDLGSTNGTFVNGHKIDAVSLSPRDDVSVAQWHMRIELA